MSNPLDLDLDIPLHIQFTYRSKLIPPTYDQMRIPLPTVGFGDVTPETDGGHIFTLLYGLCTFFRQRSPSSPRLFLHILLI